MKRILFSMAMATLLVHVGFAGGKNIYLENNGSEPIHIIYQYCHENKDDHNCSNWGHNIDLTLSPSQREQVSLPEYWDYTVWPFYESIANLSNNQTFKLLRVEKVGSFSFDEMSRHACSASIGTKYNDGAQHIIDTLKFKGDTSQSSAVVRSTDGATVTCSYRA